MSKDQLRDYEWREFERWVKSEYPDMAEEFNRLPKTFIDFVKARYSYLFEEFIKPKGFTQNCVVLLDKEGNESLIMWVGERGRNVYRSGWRIVR